VSDDTIEYDGHLVKLPLDPNDPGFRAETPTSIRFVLRPTDTVAYAFRILAEIRKHSTWTRSSYGSRQAILFETPSSALPPTPHEADPTSGVSGLSALRASQPTVSGRLPPEIIQRVVRQHMGELRRCYEAGLRRDPKLTGTVRVKFVIDRSGSVSTAAEADSTLPDHEVGRCMVRTFYTLRFPEPDGGIVVVVYPINLNPT
jgi:hypothetical protein